MPRHFALLPAAGVGARMGAGHPKQYLDIHGRPMIWHSLRAFERHPAIDQVYVVLSAADGWWADYDWSAFAKLTVLRCGGATRAESVANGLRAMAGEVGAEDWVLVHDAARPCLSPVLLDKLLAELAGDAVGGILAAPVADTLKRANEGQRIQETVSREELWAAQTPQMFRHALLLQALEQAGTAVTDEASALEYLGLSPRLVESDLTNLKVTYPRDLEVAAWLLGG
ncbi:MAG: 2-C-methyl-D-erythritol 4-phosphate cytidylyltransferase [Pseudomonadota bacterium]|nr:2-C-methyl-D-erythritol 4-phosphate cytidylyltransferase [Pseudomonadota bacterium]